MITIKITDHSICMNGHAGRKSPDGIDRVCAAVSALTCNLINSLKDLTGDRIRAETASGMTVIEWEDLSDGGFMGPGAYRYQPGIQLYRISEINIRKGVFIMPKT